VTIYCDLTSKLYALLSDLSICLGVGLILAVVIVLVFTTLTPDGNDKHDKDDYYGGW
jgi:hypothetical protein